MRTMRKPDPIPLVKEGRVRIGKTPSVVSGKPAARVVNGEALAAGESCRGSITELAEQFNTGGKV